jgi:S1-C subfamily serine protease
MLRALSVLLSVLFVSASLFAAGEERSALRDALALEAAFQEAIKKAEPSVVCILVSRADAPMQKLRLDGPDAVPEAFGSGVVVGTQAEKGLILTNEHVVRDSKQIYVRLPSGKGSYADIYNSDPRSDLAILKLRDRGPVQVIKLGDGEHVRKGQFVLSIANPYAAGFPDGSPSASWGIISNIRRRAPGKALAQDEQDRAKVTLHQYGSLIQTDARLNLGCSGGALIDLKGELIGLTTSQAAISGSETAGGFAIPMNTRMKAIVQRLLEGREVEYGFLGVQFRNRYGSFSSDGVEVQVLRGSPLYQVLRPRPYDGVVIRAVDGIPIHCMDDLLYAIGAQLAGAKVQLTIRSYAEPKTVTLAKNYVPGPVRAPVRPPFVHGLRVDYTSVLFIRARLGDEIPAGVFVSEVEPGSQAEKKQLKDVVITQVNGQAVNTPAEFYRVVAQKRGPIQLVLNNGTEVKLD